MTDRQPGACPLFNHDHRLLEERLRLAEATACEQIFLLNLHARMANLAAVSFLFNGSLSGMPEPDALHLLLPAGALKEYESLEQS